jgi:hypothetical protein
MMSALRKAFSVRSRRSPAHIFKKEILFREKNFTATAILTPPGRDVSTFLQNFPELLRKEDRWELCCFHFSLPRLCLCPSSIMMQQKLDQFEGEEVLPSPKFAPPSIAPCSTSKRFVRTITGQGIERICLRSISNPSNVYAMEGSIFKESLYGSVHRGWLIKMDESGEVFHQCSDSFQIAIKKYSKQKMSRFSAADDPLQEFAALQHIGSGHDNILGQIDCLEDEHHYYSVMRYCAGGELYRRVMDEGPLSEDAARAIFLQLVSGMEYLQSKEIFHRDISLENILLCQNGTTPYFIDFGMCLRQPISPTTGQSALLPPMQAKGKKSYMAPEIVAESPVNGSRADIWSLGIVLFTLLSGKFIVTHASPLCPLFRYVKAKRLKAMCKQWRLGLSAEAEDLLFRMISAKPTERLSLEEIKAHPWCQSSLSLEPGVHAHSC